MVQSKNGHVCSWAKYREGTNKSHASIVVCEAMFGKRKGNNGFRYDNCVEPTLVARVEELYVVVY